MKPRTQLLTFGILGAFVLASVLSIVAAEKRTLHVELRISKSLVIDPLTRFAFATDEGMEMAGMSDLAQKDDGGYKIFEASYGLEARHHRRALIVYHRRSSEEPDQVFMLSMPADLKPTDWIVWKRPDFYETNAASNFKFNFVPTDRSTNAIPNAFGLRYKIE